MSSSGCSIFDDVVSRTSRSGAYYCENPPVMHNGGIAGFKKVKRGHCFSRRKTLDGLKILAEFEERLWPRAGPGPQVRASSLSCP